MYLSSLLSLSIVYFSVYWSHPSFVRVIPKDFIFFWVIINEIIFLNSISDCWLLTYINTINFLNILIHHTSKETKGSYLKMANSRKYSCLWERGWLAGLVLENPRWLGVFFLCPKRGCRAAWWRWYVGNNPMDEDACFHGENWLNTMCQPSSLLMEPVQSTQRSPGVNAELKRKGWDGQ